MSKSRVVAVYRGKPKGSAEAQPDPKPEKIAPMESLLVPAALLLAAESTIARAEGRATLQGVFLHRRERTGRVVGTDGARLFMASFPLETPMPSWLKDGLIVAGDNLRARVMLILKLQSSRMVRIGYARDAAYVELADVAGTATFRTAAVLGEYANYENVLGPSSFVTLDEDGIVRGREWEPVGINSTYLKHCGDVARTLEAGLEKENRSKAGMVVRAYNSSGNTAAPLVFDFSTWAGALLVMMPAKLADNSTSKETTALLAPAIKATVAALRAHATRNLAWAEETEDEDRKAAFQAKAKEFQERVAEILKRAPGLPAIAAEAPAPAPEPQVEAESIAPEAKPEPETDQENAEWQAEREAAKRQAEQEEAAREVEAEADPVSAGDPEIRRTPIRRSAA